MVEIQLDKKEGNEHTSYHDIEIVNGTYQTNFQMVTYNIKYSTGYNYWWVWNRRSFYVYFKPSAGASAIYEYYVSDNTHVIEQVQVYFSNLHLTIPLIIGIKRKDGMKYFTYKSLVDKKSSTGLPPTGDFGESVLLQKLNEEHKRRNKLVFRSQDKSLNYKHDIEKQYGNFILYKYSVHETNHNGPFCFSTDKLFEHDKDITFDKIFFSSFHDKSFDFISVSYTQSNIALLVEFNSDSSKTYFRRKDQDGYYWELYRETNLDKTTFVNKLQEIDKDYEGRVSYQLINTSNSNYKTNRIRVSSRKFRDYFAYSHTPQHGYTTKKSNVLCKDMLIQLEKNVDLSVAPIDKIQEGVYSSIVAYVMQSPKTEVPYLLELSASGNLKYCLQRMDVTGKKWRQINGSAEKLFSNDDNRSSIIREVDYYDKNLLIILITNNGINTDSYMPQHINNSSSLGQASRTSSSKIKVIQGSNLPGSTYKYCIHDFSQIFTLTDPESLNSDLAGLRLFISGTTGSNSTSDFSKGIELMTYDPGGNKREYLEYKKTESTEDKDRLYVYFYGSDNIPLLVYYNSKWFFAKSKDDYFKKWINVSALKNIKPQSSSNSNQIKKQLDHINKELNRIQINVTSGSYGLDKDNKKTVENFDSSRVKIEKTGTDYIKLNHTTKNNGPMGKVFLGGSEVMDNTNNPITKSASLIHNRVSVHYHKTDDRYKFPLLIGIGADKTTSGLFYERVDGTEGSKWEKVSDVSKIQQDGQGLTDKVNHIHYKITKSVKIQIEKKVSDQYDVMFVENGSSSNSSFDSSGLKINVSKFSNNLSDSRYECRKHTINLKSQTGRSDIGGIRMFIYNIEIVIVESSTRHTLPIFYDNLIKDVYVFFYNNSDVPLLFEYNKIYYGPGNRDQYFQKWIQLFSDSRQLISNLETINSTLNEITLFYTKNNTKYGIPVPSSKPQELKDNFYDRIKVESCKNNSYRKVTHTTLNNLAIKNIVYNGKPITGIQDQKTENQVCVYYDPDDFYYTKPLLIKVCSSTGSSVFESYSRNNVYGTQWIKESINFNSDSKLHKELKSIHSRCFIPLNVPVEKQENYINTVSKDNKTHTSQVTVDKLNVRGAIKLREYRCFQHELYNYYQNNKNKIKSELSISRDLTFELILSISGEKIHLLDKNDNIIPILIYGDAEALKAQSLYVYFYEITEYTNTDSIPLLLHYNDSFYGPESKDCYFEKWKPIKELEGVTSSSHDGSNKLLAELNKINLLLNEIDPSKKGDYGIPYCGKVTSKRGNYYENNKFTSKRIDVYNYKNDKYIMRVHSTVNEYKIGDIKSIGTHSFNEHSNQPESQSINKIVVVFQLGYLTYPKLIFLNERGLSSYTTCGYYYDSSYQPGKPMKYQFFNIPVGCDLIESLKNGTKEYIQFCNNSLQNLTKLLNEITQSRMNQEPKTSDTEGTKCKDKDIESGVKSCPVIELPPPPPKPASSSRPTQSNVQIPLDPQVVSPQQKSKSPPLRNSVSPHPESSLEPLSLPGLGPPKYAEENSELSNEVQVDQPSQTIHGGARDEQISGLSSSISEYPTIHTAVEPGLHGPSGQEEDRVSSENGLSSGKEQFHERSPSLEVGSHGDRTNQGHSGSEVSSKSPDEPGRKEVTHHTDHSTSNLSVQTTGSANGGVGRGDGSENETTEKGVGEKFTEFFQEHKEAVYGGGGTAVTIASGAYPAYKIIARFIH